MPGRIISIIIGCTISSRGCRFSSKDGSSGSMDGSRCSRSWDGSSGQHGSYSLVGSSAISCHCHQQQGLSRHSGDSHSRVLGWGAGRRSRLEERRCSSRMSCWTCRISRRQWRSERARCHLWACWYQHTGVLHAAGPQDIRGCRQQHVRGGDVQAGQHAGVAEPAGAERKTKFHD